MSGKRPGIPASMLVFAPTPNGGLAEHIHYQARELQRRGIAVTVLSTRHFIKPPRSVAYAQKRSLLSAGGSSLAAKLARVAAGIANHYILAWRILIDRPDAVLLEANTEYFALFWIWPHLLLSAFGVTYMANFHDPLRQRRFGPQWLHDLTVKLAYVPLKGGLIHGPPPPGALLPDRLRIALAPVGIYEDHAGQPITFDVRGRLGIARGDFVILAFGHVADRKNLDLLIRAVVPSPGVRLLIVGRTSSSKERPVSFYRELARELGVADRVTIVDEFVPDEDVPAYFDAADAFALTYAAGFVSQSGVLQIAANWEKPVLASGGPGPLRDCMQEFDLGEFVQPDCVEAIVAGIAAIRARRGVDAGAIRLYRRQASWKKNIDVLLGIIS